MPDSPTPFQRLDELARDQGVSAALDWLADHVRAEGDLHALFETRKMAVRHQLGLSLLYTSEPETLDEPTQRELESGLLETCREVGTLMWERGEVREGWMYLQPVGDRSLTERLLYAIPVTDDNVEALIEVGLFEGAAPEMGFQLLLDRQGTCNSITTLERDGQRFDRRVQERLVGLLVQHLYQELVGNIGRHASEQGHPPPTEPASLADWLNGREWLTAEGNHHIDTTHLASVTRLGQISHNPETLTRLWELTEYGRRLHSDFQYEGEPPFRDLYHDYGIYYRALATGDDEAVTEASKHFAQLAEALPREQFGGIAYEVLVDLLWRLNRSDEALAVYQQHLYRRDDLSGIAPHVFEITQTPHQLKASAEFFREHDDLLGFSVSTLKSRLLDESDRDDSTSDETPNTRPE